MLKFLLNKNGIVDAFLFASHFVFAFVLLAISSVLYITFASSPVSAYTASLSTSGTVTANVTPNTEGDKSISINQDSVNVVTNCRAGYNLTISSSVTDRNLYKDGNSANNTSGQYFTPVNGTAQLNNTTNQYGYSLTANTESGVFTPLPLPSAPTFLRTPSQTASQTDINDNIPVYYGVSAANTLNPGLYKLANNGTILYQLTLDESCMTFTVNFNANGGTGTMTNQDIVVNTPTNLSANSFTAPALGQSYQDAAGTTIPATADKMWTFWGWNTKADGTGDWYKDRESVTNLTNAGDTITLYAQWKQATLVDLTTSTPGQNKTIDHNTMQDMSAATCYNSDITTKAALEAAGKTGAVTLTDNRDGTTRSYDVSKLADGNCWMTTNLALGTTSAVTLTSDDTDLEEGTTFTLPAGDTTSSTTSTNARIRLTNESGSATNGVYYSWAAAVASTTSRSDIPTTSICPRNWDLPTNDQYGTLSTVSAYSSTNPTTDLPSQFLITGKFTNGATFYPTSDDYGFYWTSTSSSTSAAYGRRVNSTTLYSSASTGTTYGGNKYYRKNIRCVTNMDEASYTVTFTNIDGGATQTQKIIIGQSGTISPTTTWSRTGYRLVGWDTNSSGTNIVYTNGQSITPSSDITLYTVWKPTYTIQYNGNGADEGSMGQTHSGVYEGGEYELFASNYSKANYGFAGWSFDQNAQPGGASRIYGPNEIITAPAPTTSGETKTLYAVWVPAQTGVYMQTWNGCKNLASGTVIALKDQRDNNVYTVGKLADGNCWMMENLRLDNTAASNTDGSLAQGYGTGFIGLADPETANFINSTTANTLYSTNNIIGDNQTYRFPRYNNSNTNNRADNPTAGNVNIYSYGNYYTWAAAMANTENLATAVASEAAYTSLCPSSWRLPSGPNAQSGSFYFLNYKINNDRNLTNTEALRNLKKYPNNYVDSGRLVNSTLTNMGAEGNYWSSTAYNYDSHYSATLNFTQMGSQPVYPGSTTTTGGQNQKAYGYSVRCLFDSSKGITYNANGGSGTMANQRINANIRLSKNSFTAPALGQSYQNAAGTTISATAGKMWTFWGWNTAIDGSGDWYKDVELITNIDNFEDTTILYAQWKQATLSDLTISTPGQNKTIDHNTMQDMSAATCWNSDITTKAELEAASKTGAVTLTDNRDGTTRSYDVSKLADGNCWMTTNLALGTTSEVTLTSDDTDLAEGTTFTLPAGDTTSYTSTSREPRIRLTNNSSGTTNGAYYTWSAAVASTASISADINTSICPRNWDLPTNDQYGALSTASAYSSSNPTTDLPSQFLVTGKFTNGATFYPTSDDYGFYWTSTSSSTTAAYGTRVSSSALTRSATANTTYGGNKYYRKNVRCVASQGAINVTYYSNNTASSTSTQTPEIGSGKLAASSLFTPESNRQFKEWNTRADGTGTSYAAGAAVSSTGLYSGQSLELYAIWDETYYITFNANESSVGGTPGSATGTMTNQTVTRNVATAIKTNTFALTGYIFLGWNTKADGTGTLYSDKQKVTNLTSTGNTITLYAVWSDGALLDTGQNVNRKLKRLAGDSSATYSTQDTTITTIARSNTLPNGFTASADNTISHSSSLHPIYAWYDSANTTIYYYSEATDILMNQNSSYFFYQMRALSDLSAISTWDTIKVTDMTSIFQNTGYSASSFTLNLSSWNTSGVTDMANMFQNVGHDATTWSVGDLSNWNTSSVTNMSQMFASAGYSATTWSVGDLSNWNTSNVTSMTQAFYSAGYSATTWSVGNLSSWNTSSATSMSSMFSYAGYSATTWSVGNLSSWNTSSATSMSSMFSYAGYNATTWSVGNLTSWNTSSVTNMSQMFDHAGYNTTTWSVGDLSSWNTSNVTSMYRMFYYAGYNASSFNLDLSSWNTSSVTNMSQMFASAGYSATTWSVGNLSSWNTSSVTNMNGMFYYAGYNASSFNLDLSSWNTSSVTSMGNMFSNAGYNATTWSVTIPKTNNGTATGLIAHTTSRFYGQTTSVYTTPESGKSFTIAN